THHGERLEYPSTRHRRMTHSRAGRVGDRVRDCAGCWDDRRLAEALRAEIVRLAVRPVGEAHHDLGYVEDRRDLVPLEVRVHHAAEAAVDDTLLREREAERLDHPAAHL